MTCLGMDCIIRPVDGQYCVYILTNRYHTSLYIGVTNDLSRRVFEHKAKFHPSFSSRYDTFKLVYHEMVEDVNSAIAREKQLKDGPRHRKVALVNGMNPDWRDLYGDIA
jgi:putative endonuclease